MEGLNGSEIGIGQLIDETAEHLIEISCSSSELKSYYDEKQVETMTEKVLVLTVVELAVLVG